MKLYELTEEIRTLEQMLERDDVDQDSFLAALDGLRIEKDAKIANTGLLIKQLRADTNARKDAIRSLQERNKTTENHIAWLVGYLGIHVEHTVKTPLVTVSKQKGRERLMVDADAQLPDLFYRKELNKSALRDALKDGEEYHGVRMERGDDFVVVR